MYARLALQCKVALRATLHRCQARSMHILIAFACSMFHAMLAGVQQISNFALSGMFWMYEIMVGVCSLLEWS